MQPIWPPRHAKRFDAIAFVLLRPERQRRAYRIAICGLLVFPPLQTAAGTLFVVDEPSAGLHAADVERLTAQLHGLVEAGNTVIVVEHDMRLVSSSDWVMDIGPGAGDEGGRLVVAGTPAEVARAKRGRTAPYLERAM